MREIKFRAWDGENTVMYGPVPIEHADIIFNWTKKRMTLLQYTGLKDKNGVEIYEGDIVEIPDHWDSTMPLVEVVKYIEATFMPFRDSDWGWDADECKVIGNVHEHPDLLGGS